MMSDNEHKISVLEGEIYHAIRHCQYQRLELYLRHDYNLNVTSKDGRNGLFYALDIDDPLKRARMIRYCLDRGINPLQRDHVNGFTVLNEILARQQFDTFDLVFSEISSEIDWRALDKQGRTILHQAVELNNPVILETLVTTMSHFAVSVDVVDKNGLTPYLLAVKLHLHNMAQILLEKGHASRQKCDSQAHFSAREWETIGRKETHLTLRRKLREEINDAMKKGRITHVNKLKKAYGSTESLFANDLLRRDSSFTMTTRSGLNTRLSLSINEMMDRLSDGDRPEAYITSRKDEKTFYFEHMPPTSLPPITTLKSHQPTVPFQSLLDLLQIVQ